MARRPESGDWGLSLFADVWSVIFENMRGLSQMSRLMRTFGNMKYTLERAGDSPSYRDVSQGFENTLAGTEGAGAPGRRDGGRRELERRVLTDDLTNEALDVFEPPPGYKAIDTLKANIDIMPHLALFQMGREEMFSGLTIPPDLFGLTTARATPSGRALELEYKPTASMVKAARQTVINAVRRALLVGAICEGRAAADVQEYAENIEIVWPNDFDQTSLVISDGDMEEADDEELEPEDGVPFPPEEGAE